MKEVKKTHGSYYTRMEQPQRALAMATWLMGKKQVFGEAGFLHLW
jgi:hypothetical protein